MCAIYAIQSPQIFDIKDEYQNIYYGADQAWYTQHWQIQAGCGPTSCAMLLWYLRQTKPWATTLTQYDGSSKEGFLKLMEEVWRYVTPGKMGVNNTDIFILGAVQYGESHGIALSTKDLEIPAKPFLRPSIREVETFLCDALQNDLPVAFLNLSNGALENLDNWHWVTLIGYDADHMRAVMLDQGRRHEIDLDIWMRSSLLGGGFVTLSKG